jgi:biopolymer transport protein ExbD
MMVILVVFLLKSFSVEGELVAPAAGMELPASSSRTPVPAGLVVEVGPERVRVAGRDVLPTAALAGADTTSLAALTAALTIAATTDDRAQILVQADRRIDYRNLSQVLRACARAGWSDVSLIVLEEES